jgi:hypothetical protein
LAARQDQRDRGRAWTLETGLKRRVELMRMARTTIGGNLRRLSVALLGLWLSGAGCIFCCGRDLPEATAFESERAANQLAVPSVAAPHSCCTARLKAPAGKGSHYNFVASRSIGHKRRASSVAGVAACCDRAGQVSAQARKQRVLFAPATNSAATRAPHSLTHIAAVQASSFREHSVNLRETHLRCGVFLI